MIERIYMSITGQQQGLISKGCSSDMSVGDKCHPEHLDEITVRSVAYPEFKDDSTSPFTASFTITKYLDSATPLIFNAFKNGEILTCQIDFYKESHGTQEKIHTLKLEEAEITFLNINRPGNNFETNPEAVEHIRIRSRSGTDIYHEEIIYGTANLTSDS
jgi:type VI secretion system Hcp family effector